MTYGLFGGLQAHPGSRDRLADLLVRAAELLADDPDCLQYTVGTSCTGDDGETDDTVWVAELWTDQAAHAESLQRDDVRALVAEGRSLIAGMAGQTAFDVVGGTLPAPR